MECKRPAGWSSVITRLRCGLKITLYWLLAIYVFFDQVKSAWFALFSHPFGVRAGRFLRPHLCHIKRNKSYQSSLNIKLIMYSFLISTLILLGILLSADQWSSLSPEQQYSIIITEQPIWVNVPTTIYVRYPKSCTKIWAIRRIISRAAKCRPGSKSLPQQHHQSIWKYVNRSPFYRTPYAGLSQTNRT